MEEWNRLRRGRSGGVHFPDPISFVPFRSVPPVIRILFLLIALFILPFAAPDTLAEEPEKHAVAVFVSQEIRPYLEALDGLTDLLAGKPEIFVDVFHLEKVSSEGKELVGQLSRKEYGAYVAIGPIAARFLWEDLRPEKGTSLYSMVLNPERMIPGGAAACGISLNLPAGMQLEAIHKILPGARRIGLLFDPVHNSGFRDQAREGTPPGVSLVPVAVSSRRDIPAVLKRNFAEVDALWLVPDRTITTESLIQYIIRESIYNKVPVIGYNRFFYESGAVLSFIFDYREIGSQSGEEVLQVLSGHPCSRKPPLYRIWLNEKVAKSMGIDLARSPEQPIEAGP
jgi:putative ABC transport system substrate-binding protein